MILNIRDMDVLRRVMELGSITAAAVELNISQPAVSKMLQQAEQRLGFPLFIRQKTKLVPTIEAQLLLPDALSVFSAIETVQRLAADLRAGGSGVLTIACIPAFANSILPEVIHRFRIDRPDAAIALRPFDAPDAIDLIANCRAEIGVIIGPVGTAGVLASRLCTTELGCVLPPGHPLTTKGEIEPKDLVDMPLICPGLHLPIGAQVSRAFADADVPLRIAVEVAQSTVACVLVQAGAGIALLEGFGLYTARAHGLVTRPFRPAISSIARVLMPRHRAPSQAALAFVKMLRQVVQERGFVN
jgi:DNA-binding transcriptional LysR family regulator